MMGLDTPETCRGWRNIPSYMLCIKLIFLYRIISRCTFNKTLKKTKSACTWSVYFTSRTRLWEEEYTFLTHFAISSSERLRFTDYIRTTNWPYLLMCDAWMRPIKYNHVLLSKQPHFRHKIYEPYLTLRVQEFKLLPFSRQNSKRVSRSLLLCNLSYIRDISVAHNLAFLRTATEPAGC